MSKQEFRPCPFCGFTRMIYVKENYTPTKTVQIEEIGTFIIAQKKISYGHLVECVSCGARGPHIYKKPVQNLQEAVHLWNTRVYEKHIKEEIKALIKHTQGISKVLDYE